LIGAASVACSSQKADGESAQAGPAVVVTSKGGVVTRSQAGYLETITFREETAPAQATLSRGADSVDFSIDPSGRALITRSTMTVAATEAFVQDAARVMGFPIAPGNGVNTQNTGGGSGDPSQGGDGADGGKDDNQQCSASGDSEGEDSAGGDTQTQSFFRDGETPCQSERNSWDDADDGVTIAALGTAAGVGSKSPSGTYAGACAWAVARGTRHRAARRLVDCCNRVDPGFNTPNCSMIWWHYWPLPFPS